MSINIPIEGWLDAEGREYPSKWWGSGSQLDRSAVGAPDWAEYTDRYGGLSTKEGLCAHWLSIMEEMVGKEAVKRMVANSRCVAMNAFEGYIRNRLNAGTLVELTRRNRDESLQEHRAR